jgi:hypothetical protein
MKLDDNFRVEVEITREIVQVDLGQRVQIVGTVTAVKFG